ncbi:MAG: GNAT family N-acetyltransferase [Colwellia sp.]|nr:GNAT family N-acetyltransferase [Colwellia sp.]
MYQVVEKVACVDDFLRLRVVSGLTPRPYDAAKKALPNSLFGVQIVLDNHVVGMGRVVGDGALNFEVVDVAVEPSYQGRGLGRMIMQSIMNYLDRDAPKGAYITLIADVPELYEKFGFELSRPNSEGMYIVK